MSVPHENFHCSRDIKEDLFCKTKFSITLSQGIHCDNVAFKHQGLLPSGCLQLGQAEHPQSSGDPVSQGAWVLQLLPTHCQKMRKCSKFTVSHRPLITMLCQMHFLTLVSISCWLPANTAVKCDHKIFIHPLWQGHVAAKQAVDTELQVLSLDYPFLSDLFQNLYRPDFRWQ